MTPIRRVFMCSAVLPIFAASIAFIAVPGCSGDSTVVAEGDPVALKKGKNDALKKMLSRNPETAQAPQSK